jgi:hypothetical protein
MGSIKDAWIASMEPKEEPPPHDLAGRCRTLADYHGGTDLAERVRSALDLQREQRIALVQAAAEIDRLIARVNRLELALADDGELPPELQA